VKYRVYGSDEKGFTFINTQDVVCGSMQKEVYMRIVALIPALTSRMAAGSAAYAKNNAPEWAKPGAYVYRISTPDEAKALDNIQAGLKITANLLDGSVRQIPIIRASTSI
jgi:hypothetical protein